MVFQYIFYKDSQNLESQYLMNGIWNSEFEIFITKQCAEFSVIFYGTAKYDCVIKTREMISFFL